jgi:hypothetical protein
MEDDSLIGGVPICKIPISNQAVDSALSDLYHRHLDYIAGQLRN